MKRAEARARTRAALLKAADKLTCKKGLAHASIDDVASEAGYTKGAFYANFASKEELFLAMLDERFAERIAVLDEVLSHGARPEEAAREGGQEFLDYVSGDQEWERLFFEFAAHAARDEGFREELVARYRTLVDRIAAGCRESCRRVGVELSVDEARSFGLMLFAASNGMAMLQLLDPEDVEPDALATMMEMLVLGALAKKAAETPQS